jgi:hypothetical protein
MAKIDILIPYVNSDDSLWLSDFKSTTNTLSPAPFRFRDWGTLKYLFRAIQDNLKFDYNLILILARESQLPEWVNTNRVRIVYHRDFIPEQFLPTFNSCTIESFLFNIPDLSEQIIYFNDDTFPINPIYIEDLFQDNKPRLHFAEFIKYEPSIYRNQCRASIDLISMSLGLGKLAPGQLIVPEHSITPMLRSTLLAVKSLCETKILNTISVLRKPYNVNQYIYSDYNYFTNNYIDGGCPFLYVELSDNLMMIKYAFSHSNLKLICLNEVNIISDYDRVKLELLQIMEKKYSKLSNFELG